MNANAILSIRCNEYAHQTVSFLKRSTRSSAVVFTWYEPGAEYPPHIQLGADERMIREYYELYYHKDPMRAEVLIRDEKTVETFENAVRSCDQNLFEQYRPFLRKHRVVDEIDFVLWAGGNAVGSVALLFHQSDSLSVSKENLAGMQSYLQYAFSLMPAVRALELKSILQDTYGLTTKEREVAELMTMGESNKSIASMLGVELATVKTHLVHIFQKMEVKSRSKAIALLAAE